MSAPIRTGRTLMRLAEAAYATNPHQSLYEVIRSVTSDNREEGQLLRDTLYVHLPQGYKDLGVNALSAFERTFGVEGIQSLLRGDADTRYFGVKPAV